MRLYIAKLQRILLELMKHASLSPSLIKPKAVRPLASSYPTRTQCSVILQQSSPLCQKSEPSRDFFQPISSCPFFDQDEDMRIRELAKIEQEMVHRSSSCVLKMNLLVPVRPENPVAKDRVFDEERASSPSTGLDSQDENDVNNDFTPMSNVANSS